MSVSRECITEGVVLARANAGEGSARVVLYTKVLGLVTAVAKSAREERSQLRAHLLPGSSGTFRLVKGRDLWRIAGASGTTDAYFSLSGKARLQKTVARVVAGVRQFVHGEGADESLFNSLSRFLSSLSAMPDEYAPEAECIAVVQLLSALGYVKPDARLESVVRDSYEPEALARAREKRAVIVRAINEAIHASGL